MSMNSEIKKEHIQWQNDDKQWNTQNDNDTTKSEIFKGDIQWNNDKMTATQAGMHSIMTNICKDDKNRGWRVNNKKEAIQQGWGNNNEQWNIKRNTFNDKWWHNKEWKQWWNEEWNPKRNTFNNDKQGIIKRTRKMEYYEWKTKGTTQQHDDKLKINSETGKGTVKQGKEQIQQYDKTTTTKSEKWSMHRNTFNDTKWWQKDKEWNTIRNTFNANNKKGHTWKKEHIQGW